MDTNAPNTPIDPQENSQLKYLWIDSHKEIIGNKNIYQLKNM